MERTVPALTDRQEEFLRCFADGLTFRETASALDISPRTAKAFSALLVSRLGVDNKRALIRAAREYFAAKVAA